MFATINRLDLKLIFWTSLLTILIIVAYASYKFPQERRSLMKQMNAQGGSLTYAISKAAIGPILYDDIPALQTLTESLIEKNNSVAFIRIRLADDEKTLVTEEFSKFPDAPSRTYREKIEVSEDYQLGVVEIGILTAPTEALINERMWSLAVASVLIILIKIITEFVVIGRMVRHPLRTLAERATELGQGDLDTVITLPGHDELVLLANTLDGMRCNLQTSYNKIRRQNEELKELDRMKDDFLANVTHELKTPLNGILGLGQAIQDGAYGTLDEVFHKPIGQIITSADRLLQLTLQILAFAPEKQTSANRQELFLQKYITQFMGQFEGVALEKGITIDIQVDPALRIDTDPKHLETILTNLVGNALKFTHEGQVRMMAQSLGTDAVRISVEDTGIGIHEEFHKKIFERFQQGFASESRAYEGSGLGLSITKQSLEVLQGAIHLESAPGTGSLFTILLPLREGVDQDALLALWSQQLPQQRLSLPISKAKTTAIQPKQGLAPAISPDTSPGTSPGTSPDTSDQEILSSERLPSEETLDDGLEASILVVDDDGINREVIRANLSKNFKVIEAENGTQCLEMIQQDGCDLVLLDLMMPDISGYDVLDTLQGQASSPPVIVLSAKDQTSAITRAFRAGAVDYVTKPFHKEELVARIRTHVTLRRNARKILAQNLTEARLLEKKAVAEASDQAKSEFLANMSHEIRTPMNAIIGLSQLALKTALTAKQDDYLSKIQSSAHNLLGIINDILDFSKIEAGKLAMESIPFRLNNVLDNVSNMLSVKVEEKGLELLVKCPKDIPSGLQGDPLRLGQVLINLCNNAVKFTERGGSVILAVAVEEETPERVLLRCSVRDTGIGLTPEQMDKLFKPFSQADTSITRKYGGTGLGLTICKRIVEMMDGRIWVESALGQGSIFHFTASFPFSNTKRKCLLTPSKTFQNMKVLVVDDNETAREVLGDILRDLSFKPVLMGSGEEALAELDAAEKEKEPYPLVLTDWRMPGMDGIETSLAVRTRTHHEPKKIIMVTAFGREEIMQRAQKAGVDAFLIKPITSSLLLNAIMEAFGEEVIDTSHPQEKVLDATHLVEAIAGARILLAEDNTINQQVAQEILEGAQLVVEIANHGREAVQMLKEPSSYDAVLMDLQMPEMDGYEATRHIRANPHFEKLPIIAMTAHAMGTDRDKCLAAGMNDFVTKPIDVNRLFTTLAKWIEPSERVVPTHLLPETNKAKDSHEPPMADLPGIHVTSGLKRLGGNQALFKKLWAEFKRDHAGASSEIEAILAQAEDLERAHRLVHTIKGVAGNLGAKELFEVARALEMAIKQDNRDVWSERLANFERALAQVLESVATLKPTDQPPEEKSDLITAEPLNLEEVATLLIELINLLKASDAKSEERMIILKTLLRGAGVQDEIQQLEACIDQFDFTGAQTFVVTIAQVLNVSLGETH